MQTRFFFILDAALKASENVELVDTVVKIQQVKQVAHAFMIYL